MSKTVYLVGGASGSGKSWVCNQLTSLVHYVCTDKMGKLDPTRTLELHEYTTGISTAIKRWRSMGITVIPVLVMGDFIQVKQQLVNRGGKVTKGLYRRWKRMEVLAAKYGVFTGSSSEVLRWLKDQLGHRNAAHTLYKATSPSGKIYVGKTCQPLKQRIYDHKIYAKHHSTAFSKALTKYGDQIQWETLEIVVGLEAANKAEIKWISHFDSTNKEKGYNLTEGGDGGKRSAEAETGRIAAISKSLKTPEVRKKLSDSAKAAWQTTRVTQAASIKKSRSTPESRAKTKAQVDRLKNDPSWIAKMTVIGEQNREPTMRAKISANALAALAKPFAGYKDGVFVGSWTNQRFAAEELGVKPCAISRILGGTQKQTNGYTFRYLEAGTDHKNV